MTAEQLTNSINALLRGCQGVHVPLVPCGESANDVTFLGIVFSFNGTPPTAKIYFSPRGGQPSFPAEMPEALRKSMECTIQSHGGENLRLHDASVECTKTGEIVGRMLWALRSGDRGDDKRWPGIVRRILTDLGHSGLAETLLRLDGCLREILGSELAPLCQLGGFLAPDGSLFRIKANFDADVNRSAERVEYNRDRSRVATQFLLGECGLKAHDVARMLSCLDAAMQKPQGLCQGRTAYGTCISRHHQGVLPGYGWHHSRNLSPSRCYSAPVWMALLGILRRSRGHFPSNAQVLFPST